MQPQSGEDPLGAGAVAHDMPVEMEAESLPQASAATSEQQDILDLGQAEVVNGSQQVTLEAPLTNQPLVQDEGKNNNILVVSDAKARVQCLYPKIFIWIKFKFNLFNLL